MAKSQFIWFKDAIMGQTVYDIEETYQQKPCSPPKAREGKSNFGANLAQPATRLWNGKCHMVFVFVY